MDEFQSRSERTWLTSDDQDLVFAIEHRWLQTAIRALNRHPGDRESAEDYALKRSGCPSWAVGAFVDEGLTRLPPKEALAKLRQIQQADLRKRERKKCSR